jgi:glutaredoxin
MDEAQSRSSGFGGTATLYLMRINVTPKVIQNMKNAKELLKSVGIEGKKVKEVDLTNNLSLREKIQQKVLSEKGDRSLKKGFPIIFLDDVPIGVRSNFFWSLDLPYHSFAFLMDKFGIKK